MKRRSSWSAMWCRAVISSWESAGWVNNYKKYAKRLDDDCHAGKAALMKRTSEYLALDERSEQDKDWDAGPDDEVNKVPEGQTTHFSQSHLFHLQAKSVPLVPQRTLEANQDHLQSCENRQGEFLWTKRKLWKTS